MWRRGVVAKHGGRPLHVVDDQVDIAVVVDVAIGEAPPDMIGVEVGAGVARREVEPRPLRFWWSRAGSA